MLFVFPLIDIISLTHAEGPQAVDLNHRLSTHQTGFTLLATLKLLCRCAITADVCVCSWTHLRDKGRFFMVADDGRFLNCGHPWGTNLYSSGIDLQCGDTEVSWKSENICHSSYMNKNRQQWRCIVMSQSCVYVKPVGRGGALWGRGPHETVMLPSDSSCSTGTSCYCVNEVNFKFGSKNRLLGPNPWQEVLFYNVLNISTHIYLHQGGYVTADVYLSDFWIK